MKQKFIVKMVYIVLVVIGLPLLYVIGSILMAYITYFEPKDIEIISTSDSVKPIDSTEFTAVIWNVGYAGMGAETDFFYDGGKMIRPPKELTEKYLKGIENWVSSQNCDFIMLQEVDSFSKRCYFYPMPEKIKSLRPELFSTYALNYKIKYLPMPWLEPVGKINCGLQTLSKYTPQLSERLQLPGSFEFLKQLFFLRRCLLVNRYLLANGKEMVLVNLHNSAFDDSGKLKKQEINYLSNFIKKEYEKGNFIICGGDWNECPPSFKFNSLSKGKEKDIIQSNVDSTLFEDFKFHFDANIPTNRKANTPYNSNTFTTIIDFFVVSPNVEVIETKGFAQDFKYSDHQPVQIKFRLKK